jgi:hypothetical protein
MATHGSDGFQHLLEGSITEQVMDATTCPFLVVHACNTTEEGMSIEAVMSL